MVESAWDAFCGASTSTTFHWTSTGNIDLCWHQLVLVLPSHVLLLLACIAIVLFPSDQNRYVPWQLKIRRALCVFLALVQLGGFVSSWVTLRNHPPVVWLGYCVRFFSYCGLFLAQLRSNDSRWSSTVWRYSLLHCTWLLVLGSSALSVSEAAHHLSKTSKAYWNSYGLVYSITAYATCSLHACYLVTLLISFFQSPRQHGRKKGRQLQVVGADVSESQSLLSSYRPSYGATINDYCSDIDGDQVVSAEDGASYASQLMFCWVGRLLDMGWKGELRSPDDLDVLPRQLQTESVRVQFDRHVHISVEKTYSLDGDGQSSHDPNEDHKNFSLFQALNKAFGWEYYPLGLLRLLSDLLGFAGPVLLHALVTFIENPKVSTYLLTDNYLCV